MKLFAHIEQYGQATAVIDEYGEAQSYQQLCLDAKVCIDNLTQETPVVFIKAQNNYSTVVAYVACMLAGYPVLLVAAENKAQLNELIQRYQPNIIVDTTARRPDFRVNNPAPIKVNDALCLLLSTSGSTGSPKLVKLSHTNIVANSDAIIRYLNLTSSDRAITSLPLHYSYGLSILNIHLRAGASIILTSLSVVDEGFWLLYRQHQASSFSGVPYSFQTLASVGFDFSSVPSTRYVTQAGGKLTKAQILHFANQLQKTNKQFYVMYGQTEAAPRISYLPPEFVFDSADCIGVAVDGGTLSLHDGNKQLITEYDVAGELVYQGPNIMMGYAMDVHDFEKQESIHELYTGDIAVQKSNGLFQIVGRASRFVKPFGIRVNLDDIQNKLSSKQRIVAVTGNDEKILLVAESNDAELVAALRNELAEYYTLPADTFQIELTNTLPRLSNDKFDYKQLQSLYWTSPSQPSLLTLFFQQFKVELMTLLGRSEHSWDSVVDIFQTSLNIQTIDETSTFRSLSGDSLSYVAVSSALEEYLGRLPQNWYNMSISKLQACRQSNEF